LGDLPSLPEPVQVQVLGAISAVEIAVRDAGGGIDKGVMQRIFALVRCGRVGDARSELERAERRA
jgi:signal transduction histidine kinase